MIRWSVGHNGRNFRDDVISVQRLLRAKGCDPGGVDGVCGRRTIDAIVRFQARFLTRPDGLIEPNGVTWRRLAAPERAARHHGDASPCLTDFVSRASLGSLNVDVRPVSNQLMLSLFGAPRDSYGSDCQSVTNAELSRNMTVSTVGPLRVQGLRPAIDSLRRVLVDVQKEQPSVYAALGTAGMLCCRLQRGSATAISNHSWGTAIDLKIDGELDARGDKKIQYGLTLIAPIFNRHGWYWGAGFHTEDAMHFEGGRTLVQAWKNQLI